MTRCRSRIAALCLLAPAAAAPQAAPADNGPPLHRIVPRTPADLRALFRHTGRPLPFVSAHRGGAAPGFPENCIPTFERTLAQTFAILEVDPRRTRDGAIVLHHDATLERTTTGTGRVADLTLAKLKTLRLRDPDGRVTDCVIPTLDEALEWARGRTVLVLDQKDVTIEARVRKIEEHAAEAYAMLIVGSIAEARACHALNTNVVMEVIMPDRRRVAEFSGSGVPWAAVVAFVGHEPPVDPGLCAMIHAHGAGCMAGTSRNLDRQLGAPSGNGASLAPAYRDLLARGVDILETDLPGEVAHLVFGPAGPRLGFPTALRIA